jgi:hypothetical protein
MDLLTRAHRAMLALLVTGSGFTTSACIPELADGSSRVDTARVIAVRAEPAEAQPGRPVAYTALYADATGELAEAPIDWAYCLLRKPLSELGPVNRGCFVATDDDALSPLGAGLTAMGTLPRDGCRLFGPTPPPPRDGEPVGRPVDPDATGGFYQPVRLRVRDDAGAETYTLFEHRITCGAAGTTQEQALELTRRSRPNANPVVAPLLVARGSEVRTLDGDDAAAPLVVAPGETLRLGTAWPDCPEVGVCGDGICSADEDRARCLADCRTPAGCGGAEHYVAFDPVRREVVLQRESIRVAWLATGGVFAEERTGREPDDTRRDSENAWTAPDTSGDVTLWVVLRDDRGGTAWQRHRVRVVP